LTKKEEQGAKSSQNCALRETDVPAAACIIICVYDYMFARLGEE